MVRVRFVLYSCDVLGTQTMRQMAQSCAQPCRCIRTVMPNKRCLSLNEPEFFLGSWALVGARGSEGMLYRVLSSSALGWG